MLVLYYKGYYFYVCHWDYYFYWLMIQEIILKNKLFCMSSVPYLIFFCHLKFIQQNFYQQNNVKENFESI